MKVQRTIWMPCPHCGQSMPVANGLRLRALREVAGLSQRTFAALVDASSPYVSDIERNRRRCPADVLAAYEGLAAHARSE